jgi:hypothetical protein
MWYRVFGRNDAQPDPAALLRALQGVAPDLTGHFAAGGRGWFAGEFAVASGQPLVLLRRFWRDEEGIRAELQTWAAWLETCAAQEHHGPLMQHMISTQQVFTLERLPDSGGAALPDDVCTAVCQFLARTTDGVYQVDGQGFFSAAGALLVREE